jgi:PAS domain S-box-containing protein
MIKTTRFQIALILCLFCFSIFIGFILLKRSNDEKIDALVSEMRTEKAVLLDRIIDFKSKSLLDFSFDYTYWDEMVDFVKSTDPVWAKENIESSIPTYNVDYVWVFKPDLTLVYATSRKGIKSLPDVPFDHSTLKQIVKKGKLLHFFIPSINGVIEISMATVHPTFDSERKTPAQGYYFAGRLLTQTYLDEIGLLTESKISLDNLQETIIYPDSIYGKFELNNYKILKSWNNLPVARIISSSNIKIFEILSSSIDRRFLWGTFFSSLFVAIILLFFWLRVYRPLSFLSKSLKTGNPDYINGILSQKGEFGQLSALLNSSFKQRDKLVKEISERKLVEKQLRKLSTAIEQSPVTIIITGKQGKIEYVNPKFTEVTGYTFEEVFGKNPRFLKSGNKSAAEYRQIWETILTGKVWQGELDNKKKSGELYYETVVISPIFDDAGNISNFLSVNEDITERRRDEMVRDTIFEIAKAGSVSKTLENLIIQIRVHLGILIDVTNFYLALYDYDSDTFTLPVFQDQKDRISTFKAAKTLTAYVLRTKKSFLGTKAEIDRLKREGKVESIGETAKVWLGVPLIVDDKAIGVFTVQSYTNEKAFSEKDKEMLEFVSTEICHTIERLKAEEDVRAALEKAEGSDRLKSAFLANMSHEIRTPLNSILGFTELLNDPEIGPANQEEFTGIIKSSGKQLLSIINDILDFSMIEAGQIRIVKSTFSVEKVFREIYYEFLPSVQEKGLEFKVDPRIFHNETHIENDFSRLRQVLCNLMNNALKFTRSGSIELGFSLGSDGIIFFVKDTGVGIPYSFKNYVFERFQQAEKLKSRNYGGNGLGLAISKNLVEMMGGKIWFESEEGKGSVFYFFLPLI